MKEEMNEQTKSFRDKNVWMRGLFMLLFLFLLGVAKFVAFVVILVQFLTVLFTSKTNEQLLRFGETLSIYHYQVIMYLTYNLEEQPFPMNDWPQASNKNIKQDILQ